MKVGTEALNSFMETSPELLREFIQCFQLVVSGFLLSKFPQITFFFSFSCLFCVLFLSFDSSTTLGCIYAVLLMLQSNVLFLCEVS